MDLVDIHSHLLWGLDDGCQTPEETLEAARALDPRGRTRIASRERTAAVINTDKISTIRGLACQEVELHRKGITIGVERLLQGRYPVDRDDLPTRLKLFEGHDRPAGPVAPGCLQ